MDGTEELVTLFRRFGGKFDNAALGYREDSGFYCYTLDGSRDTMIACPAPLLVDTDDVGVSEDGLFVANPDKYADGMEFLEKYFAFHFNHRMLQQYISKKQQLDSLTDDELSRLAQIFERYQFVTGDCGELEFAKRQILRAHKLRYYGKHVLIPFVSFLNHAKTGRAFNIAEDYVSVSGKFSDEVFAIYNVGDVIMIAGDYGFITDTRWAYSVPMTKMASNGTRITIVRDTKAKTLSPEGFHWPLVHKDQGTLTISWFPLYFERDPRYPARVARMIADETGQPAEEILYEVLRANLGALAGTAFQLGKSGNPFARLAAAAQRQLEVIGGTRP